MTALGAPFEAWPAVRLGPPLARQSIIRPMIRGRSPAALAVLIALGCGAPQATAPAERTVTLSVVGTNDLHGHLRALPFLASYLEILRELRRDDGGVVVLDGGDMFQGTLESNMREGASVVDAYGLLEYDAAAIGNHEFDYGPEGPAVTPRAPGEDPRGALLARARQARFPLLNANLRREDGEPIDWERVAPSALLERAGVRIGVVGVTTEDTLTTTIAANVRDLRVEPLAQAIAREATSLRARGARVVIVAAHAGGVCDFERPHEPTDLSACRPGEEIFAVAEALPTGTVDLIVAGHTHAPVAHVVNGVPIIESYSYGRAFGRVDLRVDPDRGVIGFTVHAPRDLCESGSFSADDCVPGTYEGRVVAPEPRVTQGIAPALDQARALREQPLGTVLERAVLRSRDAESPLGNLFTDLMRAARPDADVALTNGGGLRADLPAGALTYGALYEAMPFDNRFARVRLSAGELAAVLAENLGRTGSFFSIGGLRAEARCEDGALRVALFDERGAVPDDRPLTLITTDFLATGGDGALGRLPAERVTIEDAEPVREAMAAVLRERGGVIRPEALHDAAQPRVRYPGERPVRCD